MKPGEKLPAFDALPGVDGNAYGSTHFTNDVFVIVFSCNHCPYVQAYEDRIMQLVHDYAPKGVGLLAINSNDEHNYPEDSFAKMVERARKRGFNYPYVRDEDQSVADKFGATHTPQFFLFDRSRTLRYLGKMDDNWKEPENVKETYLRDALDAVIAGREVAVPETFSIGCTIKWK